MQTELNRRTFLAVLGATITVAATPSRRKLRRPSATTQTLGDIYFFKETPCEPANRPRTSAITYLQDSFHV